MPSCIFLLIWAQASRYNAALSIGSVPHALTGQELTDYEAQMNVSDSGIIAYISIPKISVNLPVYRGTDEAVLQVAIGHMEGSSLPVGGESTHAVLSSHRGLPSARLFTDLDQLAEVDTLASGAVEEMLDSTWELTLFTCTYDGYRRISVRCRRLS